MEKILKDFFNLGKDIIKWFDINVFSDIDALIKSIGNFVIKFLEILISLIRWVINHI